jgi:hypothetical protein
MKRVAVGGKGQTGGQPSQEGESSRWERNPEVSVLCFERDRERKDERGLEKESASSRDHRKGA